MDRRADLDLTHSSFSTAHLGRNHAGLCLSALDEPNSCIRRPEGCAPAPWRDARCIRLGVVSVLCSLNNEIWAPETCTSTSMRSFSTARGRDADVSQGAPSYGVSLAGDLLGPVLGSS